MAKIILKLWFLGILALFQVELAASRRPIWNIGHMVNNMNQVNEFLSLGANGIEADIAFDQYGIARYTYHGIPCDCFRNCLRWENVTPFLEHLRAASTPGDPKYRSNFVFLFLDLKMSGLSHLLKAVAVRDITTKLVEHLWRRSSKGTQLKVVYSCPSSSDIDLVPVAHQVLDAHNLPELKDRIGFEIYSYEDLSTIRRKWSESRAKPKKVWQGDGITNCLPRSTSRLIQACDWRDNPNMAYMNKVVYWTVDKWASLRSALRLGVDAILSNHPDRLVAVLKEPEFSPWLRMATANDDPFETYVPTSRSAAWRNYQMPDYLENVDPNEENITDF